MNSELQMLLDLQQLDLRIAELSRRSETVPQEIQRIDQLLEENQLELERLRQRVEEFRKKRRSLEGETDLLRQKLSKYKDQLMGVKTNKEYQAVLQEIALVEQEIGQSEDRILDAMLAADEASKEAAGIEKGLRDNEQEIHDKRAELVQSAAEAQSQIEEAKLTRIALAGTIPLELKELYDRIAGARGGVALAAARDQSCQICHVRMRPQLFSEIKTNQRIVTCESCNRILYYSPD